MVWVLLSNKKPTAANFKSIPAVLHAGPLSTVVIVLQLNSDDPAPELDELRILRRRPNLSFAAPPAASEMSKELALRGPVKMARIFGQDTANSIQSEGSSPTDQPPSPPCTPQIFVRVITTRGMTVIWKT